APPRARSFSFRSATRVRSQVRLHQAEEKDAEYQVREECVYHENEHRALRYGARHYLRHGVLGEVRRVEPVPAANRRYRKAEQQALDDRIDEIDGREEVEEPPRELHERGLDDEGREHQASEYGEDLDVERERRRRKHH